MDSTAISLRAAQRHAVTIAAGPPPSARRSAPAAAVAAVAALVCWPLLPAAALALAALALLLLCVHRQDARNAWRYQPEPVTPARFLPPRRVVEQVVVADVAEPAVRVLRAPVPEPRVPVEEHDGVRREAVATS